ncbi:PilZ domain-containing protein [Qipengyuania sp.]|uniref:PilZ domain-containing protein n=1 Tax=Qipengyuania sp. TaxID=2004515 RepID=UPI003513D174
MDRRSEPRSGTLDDVRIMIDGVGLRCAMRNLSPSGCMVECHDIVARVGSPVELILLPGYVAEGEVAWQLGESLGIFFAEPISPGVVRHYALDDWMLRGDWSMATWRTAGS